MAVRRRVQPAWVPIVPGVERQDISEVGGTRFCVYRLEGGRRFDYHTHPQAEMGVVVTGGWTHRLLLDFGTRGARRRQVVEVVCKRGDCYYVPPNVPHAMDVAPGHATVCVDLLIDHLASAPPLVEARRRTARVRPGTRRRRRQRV